ncbi:hypothetical protein MIND_01009700 [Mycena indigotica]|uniref:Uncharacterized protein n=1 Tax=Mycena indigotica TaxID=2126181 RepID=A0A8H6VYB8_9AGAR|nr:uncharacterized protein MIND_01009700 [Mycena indigotica]KAF7294723.1 hypothetical protein MIND_01009700 [Mycena indigotica]
MNFKVTCIVLAAVTIVNALDFGKSQWIWTNEVTSPGATVPTGSRAFRKTFTPPLGKTPVTANILMDVDDAFTLFVNGAEIGFADRVPYAEQFCVALQPCLNVFAVTAVNTGGSAGLLAAIEVTYSDGSTSTLISDTTWRYSLTVTSGYEQLSFDDNAWTPALSQATYGAAPWGQIETPKSPPVLSLVHSFWVWTNEVSGGVAPLGTRAFRRTYTPQTGATPTSVKIVIVGDDSYTLWINGDVVGSGTSFANAQTYTVALQPAASVVFAVQVTNGGATNNPAGLLASVQVTSIDSTCGCNSSALFGTDADWKYSTTVPAGFEQPAFNDAAWPQAIVEAPFGSSPWGTTMYSG